MATIAHKDISGANVHEPKGISGATGGQVYVADGAGSGAWAGITPVGAIIDYAGTSAPNLWALCYGQAVSRTTYAAAFAVLGTTFGVGDGSTTFNLPDLRGRVSAGQDDMGGTSANRMTSPLDGDSLGAAGGSETHSHTQQGTLTTGTVSSGGISSVQSGAGAFVAFNHSHSLTLSGSTSSDSSIQPTLILNKIIFLGA